MMTTTMAIRYSKPTIEVFYGYLNIIHRSMFCICTLLHQRLGLNTTINVQRFKSQMILKLYYAYIASYMFGPWTLIL